MSTHDLIAAVRGDFPAFQSDTGAYLRQMIEALPIKGLLLELITAAESAYDSDDWLAWIDPLAAQTFVDDTDFLSRWLHHEIDAGRKEPAKAIYSVLKSLLSVAQQSDNTTISARFSTQLSTQSSTQLSEQPSTQFPSTQFHHQSAAESLARYCYFIDDVGAGDKWTAWAATAVHEFTADKFTLQISRLEAYHRVTPTALLIAETREIAKYCEGDRERMRIVLDFLDQNHLHEELIAFIEAVGGSQLFQGEYPAYLYFSCLEIVGELPRCLAEAQAYLTQYPTDYPIYAILRSIAHKLDRHDVAHAKISALQRNRDSLPEVWELIGFDALDQDDYAEARRCLKKIHDHSSESYLRLNLACETTVPKARYAHRAYQQYRASSIRHVGPELQYVSQLFNDARSQRDLRNALSIVVPHIESGRHNVWYIRLLVQLYVSVGEPAEAREFYDALPYRLRSCQALKDIHAYFQQQDGDETTSHALWNELITGKSYRAITSTSSPPQTICCKHDPQRDQILVFVCVYNAMEYVKWFLEHYRQLKVDHFMIVDNGSTDGTAHYLAEQPDVSLFSQPGSFKESAHGVSWINHLIQQYALGKWCFFVDIDEAFIYPGHSEGRSLQDLLATADEKNQRCFPSYMLDLFATKSSVKQPGFAGHCYFDNDYHLFPSIVPPYIRIQGGVRARLTGRQFLITKSPLVKPEQHFRFTENNHTHTHLKPSDSLTALLHYKFIGQVANRVDEAIARKQHFMAGRFYKDMQNNMSTAGIRRSLATRKLKHTLQLEKLGLLGNQLNQ